MILDASSSFVIYQKPNSDTSYLINGKWNNYTSEKTGFIIQSFNNKQQFILEGEKTELENQEIHIVPPLDKNVKIDINKSEYIEQVRSFIAVCDTDIHKVVSSRVLNHKTNDQVNLFNLFKAYRKQYKNAFVYLLNIPNYGMWMGATPETIVSKSKKETYTMALAGSQLKTNKPIVWEEKEIEEHQFVIDDILEKLTAKKITSQQENTTTIYAGDIAHLHTKINITSSGDNLKPIADILHPTSAVCGMPQEKAKNFILKNEQHNREFYTGYLGLIDENLYVNLRCMKVYDKKFKLYIGGGITKASNAEKEWEETELKSKTLLSVIEKM